jgi:hypothetical protein
MEVGDIILHHRRRVAPGIDGDEDRNDLVRPGLVLRLEGLEALADRGEIGRADVRAMGEAEIHDPVLAGEIAVADLAAILVGERERPADRGPASGGSPLAGEQAASASASGIKARNLKRSFMAQAGLSCYTAALQVETGVSKG